MSFTVIPASIESHTDLSSGSLRIGLAFTAPVIAALIAAPKYVLGIIGPEYTSAEMVLLALAIAILPTAIVMNAISKLNNQAAGKKIVAIGIIHTATFLTFFLVLVPYFGTLGAAYSIAIGYTASAAIAVYWFERLERRFILNSILAVTVGCITGYLIGLVFESLIGLVTAIIVTSIVVLALKITSVSELRYLAKSLRRPAGKPLA
jgi:O-antigen/teichoic acid export membrane protein